MSRNRKVQLEVETGKTAYTQIEQKIKIKKKQRRNFLIKIWMKRTAILLIVVSIGIGYIIFDQSPYAKITATQVSGNIIYTVDEIKAMSQLNEGDRRLAAISFAVENKMKSYVGIESAKVTNNIFTGKIAIQIQEKRAVAYKKSDVLNVYYGDGSVLQLPLERESSLAGVPYLTGFDDEVVLNRILSELEQLPPSIIFAISQINQANLYNDENMLYFYMRDGYIVISSQFGISALEKWREMVSLTTSTHQCWIVLDMDETSQQRVFQTSCP